MKKTAFQKNVLLKNITTLKTGGFAKYFIQVKDKNELKEAVEFSVSKKLPIFILGKGSNVCINDKNYNGVVIQIQNNDFDLFKISEKYAYIKAGGGLEWDEFVEKVVDLNFQGAECLSGIPGTVGAGPVQNIGAYGQELSDIVLNVNAYDVRKDKFIKINKDNCVFSYRDSIFSRMSGKVIIWEVSFKLKKEKKPVIGYKSLSEYLKRKNFSDCSLSSVRNAVLSLRKEKLEDPEKIPNAGSFFKNPVIPKEKLKEIRDMYPDIPFFKKDCEVKLFAGWMIEKAGWKGRMFKDVGVSGKNSQIIINPKGKGSARQVKQLSERIKKDVREMFSLDLENEVKFIGF